MNRLFRIALDGTAKSALGELDRDVVSIAYSGKHKEVFSANFRDRSIRRCSDGRMLFRVPHPGGLNGLCTSNNGLSLIARDDTGSLAWLVDIESLVFAPLAGKRGFDTFSKRYRDEVIGPRAMNGICDCGDCLLVTATDSNRIFLINEDSTVSPVGGTGQRGFSVASSIRESMLDSPRGVCMGGDRRIYVGDSGNGAIRVLDYPGMVHAKVVGNPMHKTMVDGDAVAARMQSPSCLSSYGNFVSFLDGADTVRVMDIRTMAVRTLVRSAGQVGSVACAPDAVYFTEAEA